MSKLITYIPLSSVERIELRVTNCRKTLSQVKGLKQRPIRLNGGMSEPRTARPARCSGGRGVHCPYALEGDGLPGIKGPDIHTDL